MPKITTQNQSAIRIKIVRAYELGKLIMVFMWLQARIQHYLISQMYVQRILRAVYKHVREEIYGVIEFAADKQSFASLKHWCSDH